MEQKNIVVIGGGPAGYTAAIRASQLGARVTLIEQHEQGGACLNRACIPTKYLLRSVEVYQLKKNSEKYGVSVTETGIDVTKLQSSKYKMISTLRTGLRGVIEKNGIELIKCGAKLKPDKRIELIDKSGNKRNISADKVILATGSRAVPLSTPGVDKTEVMFAEDVLNLNKVPESMVIIGAGAVGVEIATILAKMGCQVSLIEIMPRILFNEDAEITVILEGALKRDGVRVYTGAKLNEIRAGDRSKLVSISTQGLEKSLEAKVIAIAIGYKPNTDGLGLDECAITMSNGCIKVDEHMQTSVPDIFAAGDVTGGIMLAHVAMAEGRVAAENALGSHSKMDYRVVPRCIFTLPEIACVGLSEEEANTLGYRVKSGRFPLAANSAANILGERRGIVKIVVNEENDKVIGVHIIGAGAVNLIGEATLAIELGATLNDIKNTLHAHPTLSEAFAEAALDVNGETIHLKR
jgi:dihydrolipoamide dehydrogenase